MKKKYLLMFIIALLLLIFITFVIYFFIPWGTEVYYTLAGDYEVLVPKYMKIEEENNEVVLSAYRQFNLIKKEFVSSLNGFMPVNCHDRTIYYSDQYNYSISSYGIHKDGFKTVLTFTYIPGNWCEIEDDVKSDEEHQFDFNYFLLLTEDNASLKKILSNEATLDNITVFLYGLEDIQVLNGLRYTYLRDALLSKYKTIDGIISYFEYEQSRNRGEKNIYSDGTLLYSDSELSLLVCPTSSIYYFGTKNLEYHEGYCSK